MSDTIGLWGVTFADGATVAIAAIVAFITFKQYLVPRDQMRHELFERRFEIYKKVQVFLSNILETGQVAEYSIPDFYDSIQNARFLFGHDVNEYLVDIRKHAFAQRESGTLAKDEADTDNRIKYVNKASEELKWLTDQLGILHERFWPYMNFSRK